jgi:mono/diheme cytochrome c family protein
MKKILIAVALLTSSLCWSNEPDWSRSVILEKGENRENIYNLSDEEFSEVTQNGFKHAVSYPISVTGLLIPYQPLINFFEGKDQTWFQRILSKVGSTVTGVDSEEKMYQWLGLNPYNDETVQGIYNIPRPDNFMPGHYMGASIIDTPHGKGLSFSCATCHTANLFGTSVMGLTNKVSQANRLFVMAKKFMPLVSDKMFQKFTHATDEETKLFRKTKKNLGSVGAVRPQTLGMDTSLPQVALSLARRNKDEFATKNRVRELFPRHNPLERVVADSKPLPWWNLKYKTRWLADGSIVAGNPIYTNFLWNEIGRGTDLKELMKWLEDNQQTVKELTAAAFATKPPHWLDFFPVESLDLEQAKRGQVIFNKSCKKCHGEYVKAWDMDEAQDMALEDKFKTLKTIYHKKTPVKNVGTDPMRYEGIKYFAEALNNLAISKYMKTVVQPQKGYVPPPLDGIWARWPYFHNNSIPTLCELMKPPKKRVKSFYQIPAESKTDDFDMECVGFPLGKNIPKHRKNKDAFYNTRKSGMSNSGHYQRIFTDGKGNERYTEEQKKDLLMFLKTL